MTNSGAFTGYGQAGVMCCSPFTEAKYLVSQQDFVYEYPNMRVITADNLNVSFQSILAESALAKNILLYTGDGSPYVSLYGRHPRLLPQLEDIIGEARQDDENGTSSTRHTHRLCELSVARAVEAMAQRRLKIAERSRTGQQLNLVNGDK